MRRVFGIVQIAWHPDRINKPVYEKGDGHIWSNRARFRAGFPSITNHDFRAEGLSY